MSWIFASYLSLGAIAGLLAGLFGLGGGIVVVPAFYYLFATQVLAPELTMHLAVASSLAAAVFTSAFSTLAHQRQGAVIWPVFWRMVPGIAAGGAIGAWLADFLPSDSLRILFGGFLLIAALQLAAGAKPPAHRELPGAMGMFSVGAGIGTISTILGIGGGTMTGPFLMWCNVLVRQAVATSAACVLPIALTGAVGLATVGWGHAGLPDYTTGYIYWPAVIAVVMAAVISAPLGAYLAHTVPVTILKRLFALVVAMIGLRMLW